MAAPKLGIIAGGGLLPGRLANACRTNGRPYFVLAIEGHAEADWLAGEPYSWIRMGDAGKGVACLRAEGVEELVLAGPVRRPSLKELRPDSWGVRFLARAGREWIGDDSILSALIKALEAEGFRVVGADSLLAECISVTGCYGRCSPDEAASGDLARGLDVVRAIGALDIGQAAIVQQGIVLGVEGAEGADALIRRCAPLQREGARGILVKASKPGQERRADLPAIGSETVRAAMDAGLQGIAVEAGGVLVFDREDVVRLADEAGLFVVGI
jgi:UDP-2,3-diacylglucosamine hydrolase